MNVLIVGGGSVFVSQLIEKFNKEGWEVYHFTGSRKSAGRHPYVFEKYDFPYDTDSVKEIIDSAAPDVVVFTGAYDGNFTGKGSRREFMYYISGLANILMASQMLKVPLFVYISSHEVYEGSESEVLTEDIHPTPASARGMMILQGENLTAQYGETTQMDTIVLRPDHMYWIPGSRKEVGELHGELCLQALGTGKVTASAKHIFSSVYIEDAIYLIYEIIKRKDHQHRIYHITSAEEENEIEIAKVIQKAASGTVEIMDNTIGMKQKTVMSGDRLKKEFGEETRFHYAERLCRIMEYMDKNRNRFLKEEKGRGNLLQRIFKRFEKLFYELLPFAENFAVFILVFLLNNRTADSEYFRRVDVFLLYVVLFALFYGKRQAILAAFFSTLGFVFRQAYYRTAIEVLVDYNIYIWMAQLFIVGMAVGHLRDSLKIITDDKDEEIAFLSGQLEDIYDINSSNLKVKNILEDHIVSYDDSLGMLENITSSLEQLNPGEAMYQAAEVLSQVLGTEDVSIYKVSGADFCRLLVGTTEEARQLGKSLKYSSIPELTKSLAEKEVFVNRKLQEELPSMAYGLRCGDRLEYILMLWRLPFERISLHQINLLKVVGNMIRNAIVRTDLYIEAVHDKRYIPDTGLLNEDAFEKAIKTSEEISKRNYAESALLCLDSAGTLEELQKNPRMLKQCNEILQENLRETDAFGVGKDGYLYILLTNTSWQEADVVIRRFERQGLKCRLKERI